MRQLFLITFVFILTISASPQNANVARPTASVPVPAKTTLRARVYYEDTGRPVRRMSVMLLPQSGAMGSGEVSGVTDASGNLEIKNMAAGKYYAVVNAPGVVTPLAFIDLRSLTEADAIQQLAGLPTIDLNGLTNANVEIAAKRGASVTGRIMYADGDPAVGVKVEILRKVGDEYLPTMPNYASMVTAMMGMGGSQTDDRGVYRFAGLLEGEYVIKVTENVVHADSKEKDRGIGSLFMGNTASMVSVFFENAFRADDAQPLKLLLGQEVPEVNIVIPERPTHSITGKVVAAKDQFPVRGATLRIKRLGDTTAIELMPQMSYQQLTTTDGDGRFEFRELPKGKYSITVEPVSSEFDRKAQAYGYDPEDGTSGANTNAAHVGRAGSPKPLAPELAKVTKEFEIEDDDLKDQIVELSTGATIVGTIASQDNEAIADAVSVTARNDDSGIERSETVSFYDYSNENETAQHFGQKEFRLTGITPGKTSFSIKTGRDEYYVKSATSNQIDLLAGPVDLKSGETLANIRIVISKDTGTLKGKVIDDDKQPVAGRLVTFIPTDKLRSKNPTHHREARTDMNGEFEIKLAPFEYAIVFLPKGTKTPTDKSLDSAEKVQIDPNKTSTVTIKRNPKD